MRQPLLGVIADDFTGATDVASMLVRAGMRTLQCIGVPTDDAMDMAQADAIVVALKSRTIAAGDAVTQSLAALAWLQRAGASRFYFKVCSTFDSTPAGNIGPVAEALLQALAAPQAIVCPAFPENGRTVFRGHLFVGDELLAESGMRHHPLTPMTDSNLLRVLQAQSRGKTGLLAREHVARGVTAVRARLQALQAQGVSLVVADAVADDDLRVLGDVAADMPLLVAGSGLALGLPAAYVQRGWLHTDAGADQLDRMTGMAAVLSGSCSVATNAQVATWRDSGRPARAIDATALAAGEPVVAEALAWAGRHLQGGPVLLHATLAPDALQAVQAQLGAARAGALVEAALAAIAQGLVDAGVQRLVVAGGETSGAVVQALGVQRLRIGAAICPGVPWTQATQHTQHTQHKDGAAAPLWLVLKSGNFGGPDFFSRALELPA